MANSVCDISVTQSPLTLPIRENDPASGAIVDFWGAVRGLEEGNEITGIDYEAHIEMAEHQIRQLAENAQKRFGLSKVVIHHRIGFVPAGEASVVVRVESARRAAAFEANQWIMDELKKTVPIWKHPIFKEEPTFRQQPRHELGKPLNRQPPGSDNSICPLPQFHLGLRTYRSVDLIFACRNNGLFRWRNRAALRRGDKLWKIDGSVGR